MNRILLPVFMAAFLCLGISGQTAILPPQVAITGTIGPAGSFSLCNHGAAIFTMDADHSMSYQEISGCSLSILSSVPLTATRRLVAPLGLGFGYTLFNKTTGSQVINVCGATGTCAALPNDGLPHRVESDGTNYYLVTSGATAGVTNVVGPVGSSTGPLTFTGSGVAQSGNTFTFTGGSAGVSGITGTSTATGGVTFTGAGVTQSGNTFTFGGATGTYLPLTFTANQSLTSSNGAAAFWFNNNTGQYSPTAHYIQMDNYGPGFNLGNNGSAAQGWSTFNGITMNISDTARGIGHGSTCTFTHSGQGDTSCYYGYLAAAGGTVASSDEGVQHMVLQTHQKCFTYGIVNGSTTVGTTTLPYTLQGCAGYNVALSNHWTFDDGFMLIDSTQAIGTFTLGTESTSQGTTSFALTIGTVPVSSAWGTIVASSCTPNGNGEWQTYTSTTCTFTLGTSPASPNHFTAGTDICFAGGFQEEAAVTHVTTGSGSDSVTFSTRYAWNNSNGGAVMQGGICGSAMIASGASWPIAYALIGATSSTQIYFSNCNGGTCTAGGYIPASTTPMTYYPMAFITGNDGSGNHVLLGTNHVAWAASDSIFAAPTSQYSSVGIRIAQGQSTPGTDEAIEIDDDGSVPLTPITVKNGGSLTSYAPWAASFGGFYAAGFRLNNRPITGGVIQIGPGASGPNPFSLFNDASGYGNIEVTEGGGYLYQTHYDFNGTVVAAGFKNSFVYTVGGLPAAATAGVGASVMVSDASSYTPGTCTGGGSDYMIAISNGTIWSCH